MVNVISQDQFDQVKNAGVAVVDFYADWCGPCKMLGPVIEEISSDYEGKVEFFKMNVDENPDIAEKYNIQSIPLVIAFKNGEPFSQSLGFKPAPAMKEFVDSAL